MGFAVKGSSFSGGVVAGGERGVFQDESKRVSAEALASREGRRGWGAGVPVPRERATTALTCVSATPVASLTLQKIASIWYMFQRRRSSSSLARTWSWSVSSDCRSMCSR